MAILTLYVCDYCAREARSDGNGNPPPRPWVTIRSSVRVVPGLRPERGAPSSLDFCSPRCRREGAAPEEPAAPEPVPPHVPGAGVLR